MRVGMESKPKERENISSGIIHRIENAKGWIRLNRPRALNSLTAHMMEELGQLFAQWAVDTDVKAVIIYGEGTRAFCAGGDLRCVFEAQARKDKAFLERLFRVEYAANIRLKAFPKPYIALMQGYAMGGGMGAAIHGSHRVVTDTTLMAMPETAIGYFPDVGASYFLKECPGYAGVYLGLTGTTITASDGLYAGWATHFVPLNQFDALKKALADSSDPVGVIESFSRPTGASALEAQAEAIERHFKYATVEEIFESLKSDTSPFACKSLAILEKRCPLSLKVTLAQLRSIKDQAFSAIMASEYHLSQVFIHSVDFHEGIRAAIIDKDRNPRWQHASIYEVTNEDLQPFFEKGSQRFEGDLLTIKKAPYYPPPGPKLKGAFLFGCL